MMIVQERIRERGHRGDKRILLLEGRLLTAYRKHPPRGDFRSNLSIGGTSSETSITGSERSLIRELRPYLLREGLHLAGLDVMGGKLLDLNVTCPAGMTEAETLCPGFIAAEAWGFFLERRVKRRRRTLPNSRP
jgi:glutathione synthase